jgi:tetratricopeptide (TPR) repeat protein
MPRDKDLPEPLRPLAFRNAISVRPDPDFHNDMERLCRALSGVLKQAPKLAQHRPWAFVAVVIGVIVILALGAAAIYFLPIFKQFQRVAPATPKTHALGETGTAASRTFKHTARSPLSDPQVNDAIRVKAMVEARKAVEQDATKWIADRLETLGLAGIDANKFAIPLLDVTVTQRDIKSDQGEPIVETIAIGAIDLKTFDQHLAMPVLDDRMMDKLDDIIKREKALLNRIDRLEETNEQLQSRLAQLSSAQQQKEVTNIARASEQVANELKATDLYRQALIQQGLGRYDASNRLFTQAIGLAPDYEDARLARNSIEDAKYLVEHQTPLSPMPYVAVARDYLHRGQVEEATRLLKKATSLFPDKGVLIVELVYSPSQIDVHTISNSLTLEGRGWDEPPGLVSNSLTIVGNSVFVHGGSGLDLRKNDVHRLTFAHYGFKPVSIEVKSDEFKPGVLLQRTMSIEATNIDAENTISGRVTMVGQEDHSGIAAVLYDDWYENYGFRKEGISDKQGYFSIAGVPDGRFELDLGAPGYVHRDISIEIKKNIITCYIDGNGAHSKVGKTPCNLAEIGLALHKIKRVHLKWMLQEDPTQWNFRGQISEGDVTLNAALKYDWERGGWGCCRSSYCFGTKQIDGRKTDLVIYTALDGRIFFAQPQNAFIAHVGEDYSNITDVSKQMEFKKTEEVLEGRTYVMTTTALGERADSDQKKFLLKIKVLSIE